MKSINDMTYSINDITYWLLKNQQYSIEADYLIFKTEDEAADYAIENEYFSDCHSKEGWCNHYDEIIFPCLIDDFDHYGTVVFMTPPILDEVTSDINSSLYLN